MRKSKLTSNEIFEAEKAAEDRKVSRGNGFTKMRERDSGRVSLRNLKGGTVYMEWSTPRELAPGEVRRVLPDDVFSLTINGQEAILDAEEFRKWLRWV